MVQYLHLEERKKRRHWPKLKFADQGPKVTIRDLDAYPIILTAEHCDFLMWANGGVPEQQYYRRVDEDSQERIECVDYFCSAREPGYGDQVQDIAEAILQYRDHLPRWSIPLGRVDDDSFLLTFWNGENEGKVWLFIWLHDDFHEDNDPNDGDGLYLLADSIAEFLPTLRNMQDFWAVEAFAIDESKLKPAELKARLEKLGCDVSGRYSKQATCVQWYWDRFDDQTSIETDIFVARNGLVPDVQIADLELPRLPTYEEGQAVLYVKVSNSCRDKCVRTLQKGLGTGAVHVAHGKNSKRSK